MAKTLTIVIGVIYAILGIVGFLANPLVGTVGFFGANTGLAATFLIVGLVLLAVGIWASVSSLKVWDIVAGVVLVLFALLGFLVAPAGGTELGFAVSGSDNWLNVILGIVLLAGGLFERNTETFLRHATQ